MANKNRRLNNKFAKLSLNNKTFKLPIYNSTQGESVIDISKLHSQGMRMHATMQEDEYLRG